jgi:hypothetical protein
VPAQRYFSRSGTLYAAVPFRYDAVMGGRTDISSGRGHPQEAQFRLLQPLQLFEPEVGFETVSCPAADPPCANVLKHFDSFVELHCGQRMRCCTFLTSVSNLWLQRLQIYSYTGIPVSSLRLVSIVPYDPIR